jgi:chromate transporter
VPVTMGLLLATGWHLAPPLQTQPKALMLSVVIALLVWRTKVSLIWLVVAGTVLGGLGLV